MPVIDGAILEKAGSSRSALGSGGMRSKLRAARLATVAGESVIMANGSVPGILDAIFRANRSARCFCRTIARCRPGSAGWATPLGRAAGSSSMPERGKPSSTRAAVCCRSASSRSAATFGKGDVVTLLDVDGGEFARGLSNYSAGDIERIRGLRSEQVREVIGASAYDEVVHRDNLVVIDH